MIDFIIERRQLEKLQEAIKGTSINIRKELAVVINKTAATTLREVAKDIGSELNTTQKAIKYGSKALKVLEKATFTKPGSRVRITRTGRMSLRHFKPKQGPLGTSFKISKNRPATFVRSAFMGPVPGRVNPQWAGNVFKRIGDYKLASKGAYRGYMRQPITKLNAASPWGVYIAKNFAPEQIRRINARLRKEMDERIRFRVATKFNKAKPKPKGA